MGDLMRKEATLLATVLSAAILLGAGCGIADDEGTDNVGPWIGDWVQVNFLSDDDNGVWDEDDLSGIGFVATITEQKWIETDDYGSGCSVTFSYSVDRNNNYSRTVTRVEDDCPFLLPGGWTETGRLEFSDNNRFMIEHFDPMPGDDLLAFKWVRR